MPVTGIRQLFDSDQLTWRGETIIFNLQSRQNNFTIPALIMTVTRMKRILK